MERLAHTTTFRRARVVALLAFVLGVPAESVSEKCTAEHVESWTKLRRTTLGVQAYDPNPILAPDIVPASDRPVRESCPTEVDFSLDQDGRAHDGIHAWVFAAPCKLAVCGEPRSFEDNRHIVLASGEYDLNNNIAFDDEFRREKLAPRLCSQELSAGPRLQAQRLNLALEEPRLCFGPTETLHVEITPPTSFRPLFDRLWVEDPPWAWRRWRSVLHQRTACVYGPFVADTAHATLAEVHPAQMYWWNERVGEPTGLYAPDGPFALFVLQDGSNRYTRPHHFVLSKAPPAGSAWKPWAGGPIQAVFEIPFHGSKADPPRFSLTPYEYEGLRAPAPRPDPCTEERVKQLEVTLPSWNEPATVATACNATRADRAAAVDLEMAVTCECHGDVCPEGVLGMLTLRVRTGSAEEWREGAVGLLLSDSRASERKQALAPGSMGATEAVDLSGREEKGRAPASASVRLSWRAVPGKPAWSVVPLAPGGSQGQSPEEAMHALFRAAGWPPEVDWPITSLWRLGAVRLRADVVVPYLRDRDRGEIKMKRATFEPEATPLLPDPDKKLEATVSPLPRSSSEGLLAFGKVLGTALPVDPFRVDVLVKVEASYPAPTGLLVESRATQTKPTADGKLTGRWTLWTHGLGAHPSVSWLDATRRLCDHYRATGSRTVAEGRDRQGETASPSQSAAADRLAYENVRIATERTLKKRVVSVAELALLIDAVRRSCSAVSRPAIAVPATRAQGR